MKKAYSFRTFPYQNCDGSTDWICEYPDLPGCSGVGDSPEEAIASAREAKDLWLDVFYEDNNCYPEPSDLYGKSFSGHFPIRTTSSLHRNLSIRAEEEGVSLNALCCNILSESLGAKTAQPVFNFNLSLPLNKEEQSIGANSWSEQQVVSEPKILPSRSA